MSGFGEQYQLGRRVPHPSKRDLLQPTRVLGFRIPSKALVARATSSSCTATSSENLCEKPSGSPNTYVIVLGVVIPILIVICVLIFLHRRGVKKQNQEDMMDPHKSLDFGLAMDTTKGGKSKRKSAFFGNGEKDMSNPKHRQLSMDMNLSSPYLLPPDLHNSRDSLNSLTRSIHQTEDPYGPVKQYAGSDVGSLRSFQKGRSSAYTTNSSFVGFDGPQSQNSLSRNVSNSPPSLRSPSAPPPYPEHSISPPPLSMPKSPSPTQDSGYGKETAVSETNSPVSPIRPSMPSISESTIQIPAPVAQIPRKGVPMSPTLDNSVHNQLSHQSMSEAGDELFIYDKPNAGLRQDDMPPSAPVPARQSSGGGAAGAGQFAFNVSSISEEPQTAADGQFHFDLDGASSGDDRGHAMHRRQSSEYPQEGGAAREQQTGLALPPVESKRLSVGFRPLPPDELIETEDPETRANRIRSFYKEYFDDSKPDMAEYNQHYPPNGMPVPRGRANTRGSAGGPQYYDNSNLGDSAAYFDPEKNAFVMPYAQPVSRRAMTPPPSGSRFPGGRPRGPGGPRAFHGSMGGASMGGPRPGSSVSNMRSGSAMGAPRRPLPPPADLTTLPTPAMLKDDSVAIFGAIDFAPPPTFAEHTTGRSQSPLGERRPYQLNVPVSSPLVSSFDEMPALPSPHLLRKSSTFTGLDFAPPRKFKDPELMSDAGSIRSNRSGISTAQQQAIRGGAGRVSRLPGDTVFTQAALSDQLKPQWGMRP